MTTELDYDDLDIDNLTIGEIDLAVLGRAFWLLRGYFDKAAGEYAPDAANRHSMRTIVLEYMSAKGPYRAERNIAMRMVFDEMTSAPGFISKVEKILGQQLGYKYGKHEES